MGLFARKQVAPAAQLNNSGAAWRCGAKVPNARTNTRAPCGFSNEANDVKCRECGASRGLSTDTSDRNDRNKNTNKEIHMSNEKSTVKPAHTTKPETKPSAAPTTAKPESKPTAAPTAVVAVATSNGATTTPVADPQESADFKGMPRLKFYSTKEGCEEYCARVLPYFVKKYGNPRDPWGNEMKLRATQDPTAKPKKVERLEAKEAEEKRLAAMSDEEKIAYAKAKREANQKASAARKEEKRAKMLAEVKAQLERDGMVIVPKAAVAPSA